MSADIGEKGSPSGVIFDPKTNKLTQGTPGKIDKTTPARKLNLSSKDSKLH